MITFKNISFSYKDDIVLDDFNDFFEEDKINCIVAPSGAGKTTLLNLLAGLITPSSGVILNKPTNISYVFQETRLIPEKTVFKNLDFILKTVILDKNERYLKIIEYLKIVELEEKIDKYPLHLSGGEKQRLSLIRSFVYPSSILLLDEAFKNLDIQIKRSIFSYFLKLWNIEKRTVIFVTHEIDEALLVGDNIHIYSREPLKLMKLIEIDPSFVRTKLYDSNIEEIRKQVLLEIEKW
ncbi:MAG: ATP-binding cassette domain-containing protein [Acholeplasmatales bacterium]|jgi:NitT/TauT family transport system ATP-binding protein|nr:ATP-binding cassette domain-containing protein [Acholeplasmatales bacterium]